jgi:Zn finger protein HypA/HybF involved in hydrogenase expression
MRKMTKTEFIEKAKIAHNNFYSYDNVEYVSNKIPVTITCPVHGDFEQIPNNHIRGSGCPYCYNEKRSVFFLSTTEQFVDKAKAVHENTYSYENVQYVKSNVKVDITCNIHGSFKQTPAMHLSGNGCPKCAKNYRLTTDDFIKKAHNIHNDKYVYSKVEVTLSHKVVTITCPVHGDFEQTPSSHLAGRGCPLCATSGFKINKPATFYFLKIRNHEDLYKIGITNLSVNKRFKPHERGLIDVVTTKHFSVGKDCLDLETKLLRKYKHKKSNLTILDSGNSELLNLTPEEVTSIWTELVS